MSRHTRKHQRRVEQRLEARVNDFRKTVDDLVRSGHPGRAKGYHKPGSRNPRKC